MDTESGNVHASHVQFLMYFREKMQASSGMVLVTCHLFLSVLTFNQLKLEKAVMKCFTN